MTAHLDHLPDAEDQTAMATLRAAGYQVLDIQSLASDQTAFAVRVAPRADTIAPGVRVEARTVELGGDCFTNAYTLALDLAQIQVEAVSTVDGFHLPDLVRADGALAAVSGTFTYISDDPAYQPVEPCLDFCCRAGEVVSLPTVAKPAVLVRAGRPMTTMLDPVGTLSIAGRDYRWIGSKSPDTAHRRLGVLTVFSAANCVIRYTSHPRTGFTRDVDPSTNRTPVDPAALDCVISWEPGTGHRVTSVRPGGGADLFAGNFVLRANHARSEHLGVGAPVRITRISEFDVRDLDCGFSLGPSVADAASGSTAAFDECLGVSPFCDRRCARTLIGLRDQQLWFLVFDGAPLTENFQGVSPTEAADVCAAQGWDPRWVYHLDGGQSSKIAVIDQGAVINQANLRVLGSMHYLRWPQGQHEPFRWLGQRGRTLHSGFAVRSRRPEQAR